MVQARTLSSPASAESLVMVQTAPTIAAGKIAEKAAKSTQHAEEAAAKEMTPKERNGILKQLNKTLEAFDTRVSLSLDEKSRQTIIKVIDNETGKVVRQIPNEQLMRISERITELLGVIYDEKM
jgi:flagellar protein FlaG